MEDPRHGDRPQPRIVLWIARVLSAVMVLFVLLFFVGYLVFPPEGDSSSGTDWIGLMLFPLGVCAGLLVGWRRHMLGGLLSLTFLLVFSLWLVIIKAEHVPLPILVFAVPALLYLVHGLRAKCAS